MIAMREATGLFRISQTLATLRLLLGSAGTLGKGGSGRDAARRLKLTDPGE